MQQGSPIGTAFLHSHHRIGSVGSLHMFMTILPNGDVPKSIGDEGRTPKAGSLVELPRNSKTKTGVRGDSDE